MHKQILFIVVLSGLALNAQAQVERESNAVLSQLIHTYVESNITKIDNTETQIQVGKIDNRLKLAKCGHSIKTSATPALTATSSRVSINIKCETPIPWSVYIPTKIKRLASVYVTSESIRRGDVITVNQLQKMTTDILKLRAGYFAKTNNLEGMIAKKNIRIGTILTNSHIRPPMMIQKGDKVNILARTGEIEIRMSGKALGAGAKGDLIQVTNLSSKRKLHATIIKPGVVRVSL